jgi:hypothetical protein
MSNTMSDAIADLVTKGAITDALHHYCVAIDRIDEATWWQVWHRDAAAHYEGIRWPGHGFDGMDFRDPPEMRGHVPPTLEHTDRSDRPSCHQRELRHRLHTGSGHRHRAGSIP